MPSYDFKCETCGSVREVLQSYSAESPVCCDVRMTRQVSSALFHVKGFAQSNDYNLGATRTLRRNGMKVTVTQR